mmetsp:Transcript_20547/g.51867  ORF Transcript_20547/g.51867 Transcript_20547/m.51867 type:complete len:734 (+) Transcript_20547:343-2544(+)|eukprot:CAMPEP_0178994766 /NCGR_PEP_ID=MMETSP0795-20121207/7453_1 /TAXON_ID=88552 /ORGANISM="Amoebophrya sp., Strain Ameob2" /LENGTH=733 /DNA_ID=CAMNT_0020686997 /DNA_START=275 /DNA_END=2476 /DNA_ORIENTATION=+
MADLAFSRSSSKSAPSRPPRHQEPYNYNSRGSRQFPGQADSRKASKKKDAERDAAAAEKARLALIEDEEIINQLLDLGLTKRDIGKMDSLRKEVLHPKGSEGSWGRPDPAEVLRSARALIQYLDRDTQWENPDHGEMQRLPFELLEKIAHLGFRLSALRDVDIMRVIDTNKVHAERSGGAKILEDGKIVMKRKSKKEEDERKQILISVDAFVSFIQNLVERNHIKKMFQEQEKDAPPSEEIMTRVFREFASKKLHRPNDIALSDPERPPCLSEATVLEIFEFLEVYMTSRDVSFLFQQIDKDGSGTIEESEWKEFFHKASHRERLKKRACLQQAYLRTLFEEFDIAGKGFLVMEDLMNIIRFINLRMSEEVAERLFFQIDDNHNNRIELEEFLGFFSAVQSQDDMKQKIQQMSTKKERSQWCQLCIGFFAMIGLVVCIAFGIVPLAIVCGSMVAVFLANFIGCKNMELFLGCVSRNTCVFTVARLRYATVMFGIGFLAIVIWHQFDQAEIDGDHQREGESPVVPASFVTACLVIFCVLLGANVLACLEKQGNVAKKISTFITESPRRAQAAAIKGKLISLGAYPLGAGSAYSPDARSSPGRGSPRGRSPRRKGKFNRERANEYAKAALPPDHDFNRTTTTFGGASFLDGRDNHQERQEYRGAGMATTGRWSNVSPGKAMNTTGGVGGPQRKNSAKIEPFRPLSEVGARGQIAGIKKGDQVTGMGIMKALDGDD